MGDKTAARKLMEASNVPMAPGTVDAIDSPEEASVIAADIGYPVLIKAAAGGGGKGMRVVYEPAEFVSAFEAAAREAQSAFGDGRVFIEKYISHPRHIEFQILADQHGNIIHLFERGCSIQRRHQKVIEEAPSSVLDPVLRDKMGAAAISAARSCDYTGAGTVEFLVDSEGRFFFMEMNTRLQVEHPVTEWITGIDLVEAQILVAEGHELPWKQEDVTINGHAVECRVYAEDPETNFLPGPGTLTRHRTPDGPGVRVDAGVENGDEIPIHYDPMISKVTTWGRSRTHAIRRMSRALDEYQVAGVPTTIPFCSLVMNHERFVSGNFSTHFVDEYFNPDDLYSQDDELLNTIALSVGAFRQTGPRHKEDGSSEPSKNGYSDWRLRRSGRNARR